MNRKLNHLINISAILNTSPSYLCKLEQDFPAIWYCLLGKVTFSKNTINITKASSIIDKDAAVRTYLDLFRYASRESLHFNSIKKVKGKRIPEDYGLAKHLYDMQTQGLYAQGFFFINEIIRCDLKDLKNTDPKKYDSLARHLYFMLEKAKIGDYSIVDGFSNLDNLRFKVARFLKKKYKIELCILKEEANEYREWKDGVEFNKLEEQHEQDMMDAAERGY